MKFDRNTVLGFTLLALLFFGYFFYNSQEQAKYQKQKDREQFVKDSIANLNKPKVDTVAYRKDSLKKDSLNHINSAGYFQGGALGTAQVFSAENSLIKIYFTSKGGRPQRVELKKFIGPDSGLVKLAGTDFDKLGYMINTGSNNTASTADLFFPKIDSVRNPDGTQTISFTLASDSTGESIVHEYIIHPDDYMVDLNVKLKGASKMFDGGVMKLNWQYSAVRQEESVSFEKQNTQIGFVKDGSFDYYNILKREKKVFEDPVQWLGVRQRFFNTYLVAKNNFNSGTTEWKVPHDSTNVIVEYTANMNLTIPAAQESIVALSVFYGPAEYHTLKKYGYRFEKLINLGQGMYSFVRPLNKFLVLPVFDMLQGLVKNYGIAILLLTLIIRLLISPLTYSSYLSGAKMKALRPEIAILKEKHGADRQAMSMDQMKLFREAGVNPLGGCIPALLQIPIFFALFSFFGSEVGLRGAHFLWSHDLSAPDKVIHFGTKIPLLGDHLSIFTLTAVITSFLISIYSMSMNPDNSNPMMKYLPYIFPVFLLFFFNALPSALTWYYTVSNLVTLALQFVIQTYIIDHNKILAKIEQNRKKPKQKSKWQERMEAMQEQQKKMKEMQQKNKR